MEWRGRLLLSFGLMLVFFLLLVITVGYNPLARMVPLVVVVPVFGLSVVQFLVDLRETLRKRRDALTQENMEVANEACGGEKGAKRESKKDAKAIGRRELVAVGFVLLFFALIVCLGFQVAIVAFILIFARVYGRENWRTSIGLAAICWIIVYVVFVQMLKNTLYPGILLGLLT